MFNVGTDWNPKQSRLKEIIKKKDHFDEAIALCLEMHKMVHSSKMSSTENQTYADEILNELAEDDFCIKPTENDVTIAWNIWHITRIEDITTNILNSEFQTSNR